MLSALLLVILPHLSLLLPPPLLQVPTGVRCGFPQSLRLNWCLKCSTTTSVFTASIITSFDKVSHNQRKITLINSLRQTFILSIYVFGTFIVLISNKIPPNELLYDKAIWEVAGSNLSRVTKYPDISRGFPKSVQVNADTVN